MSDFLDIFATCMEHLARDNFNKTKLINKLWSMQNHIDYHPADLNCDKALIKLKLAKKNDKYQTGSDDYQCEVLYKGLDY